MRRQLIVLRALFALAVCWLAVDVSAHGTPPDLGSAVSIAHGERMALASPHTAINVVATWKRAADWSSPSFLPSRGITAWNGAAAAPSASALSGIRDREALTFTYDATAPPATLNTVR
jgi:hypothetical protein